MTPVDVTVSIVSYNTREALLKTLETLYAQAGGLRLQTIVIDNASDDGSPQAVAQQFPHVELVINKENRLFSAAHNQAWRLARGEFFLILNSDIEIEDDILQTLSTFLKINTRSGGVGSRMYFSDGRLQRNCSRDYSLGLAYVNFTFLGKLLRTTHQRLNATTFYSDWDRQSDRAVEVIPDSFLLIRRESIQGDLYDERFGLYFTENDICLRMRRAGWQLDYVAQGRVIHQESQSVRKVAPAVISRIYRQDIRRYFAKYYGCLAAFPLIVLMEFTRMVAQALHTSGLRRFKKNLVWGIPG